MTEPVGTLAALRRYPVKSLLGENLRACDVTMRGLAGDRALAIVHGETGKVASAKNPRQWQNLLRLAAFSGPEVKIAFPDGTVVAASDPSPPATGSARWRTLPPQPCAGAYAQVVNPGMGEVGDEVRLA